MCLMATISLRAFARDGNHFDCAWFLDLISSFRFVCLDLSVLYLQILFCSLLSVFRLDTDILFASSSGLKSLLVLTGFSSLDEAKEKQKSKSPTDQKLVPDYYLPSLADLCKLLNEL